MKIFFFDSTWNQLIRFGSNISVLIKEQYPTVRTEGILCKELTDAERQIQHSFDSIYTSESNLRIAEYVTKEKPDVLVVVKHTVRDQNVVLRAKKCGAIVFELQHGMLYEGASLNNFNLREIYAAARNMRKTVLYLIILRQMCRFDKRSYFQLLKKIIMERKDVAHIVENHFSVKLNGDYAMVIGEYWVNYYCTHYDYDRSRIFLMGNHDVDNLVLGRPLEDAICYIPSVHVEDGKVSETVFKRFIESLATSIDKSVKLYIKMHPRGNIKLYRDTFANHNVTYIFGPDLPYVTTYVGHNSTLIAKALMLTNKVILWGFKEEAELFYKPWAYAFCEKPEELIVAIKRALNDKKTDDTSIEEMRKYSYINPEGAFQCAAKKIVEVYQKSASISQLAMEEH